MVSKIVVLGVIATVFVCGAVQRLCLLGYRVRFSKAGKKWHVFLSCVTF